MKCGYDKNKIINILESSPSLEEKNEVMKHIRTCSECEKIYNSFYALGKFYEDESLKVDLMLTNSITQSIDKELYSKNKLKGGIVSMLYQRSKIIKAFAVLAALFVIAFLGFSQRSTISEVIVSSGIYQSIAGNKQDKLNVNQDDFQPVATSEKTTSPVGTYNEIEVFSDLSSFSDFEKSFIKTDFRVTEADEKSHVEYNVTGSFDLDGDGKNDELFCMLSGFRLGLLKINNMSTEVNLDNPFGGKVNIVDFDVNDNYKDIVIYDDGPSGDPNYRCFRYNGKEIINLGVVNHPKLMDGYGKIISVIDDFVSPKIIYNWIEVKDKSFVNHNIDVSRAINKEYKLANDIGAFFDEREDIPNEIYSQNWDPVNQTDLKNEKSITIKYIHLAEDNTPLWYFVEFGSGKKGVLYFFLGD